jgi:predicted RNA-binding protein YlqC (UPF0109 family)
MSSAAADLTAVVRLLVKQPRSVAVETIEPSESAGATELRLRVAVEDRGQVIGRRGRTLDALRALLEVRGDAEGRSYEVELLED